MQAFYFVNTSATTSPPISFSAANGAFEGADRLLVNTDDGAALSPPAVDVNHINNAYMDTPPDGTSPTMAMFLFSAVSSGGAATPFRDVNGGDDAAIVYHEYTHGLSSRLVTVSPGGEQALNTAQAGAMGEGWSDWYAQDFLVGQFPGTDTTTPGEVDMGRYVEAVPHAIRTEAVDCPVGAAAARCPGAGASGPGGYTYGDFGRIVGGPEVHADGEIWAQTLWDLRAALGSDVSRAIVTQGMRLSPPEPSFLDERDAILAADLQLFAAAGHRAQIWAVFAARGMGWDARSPTPTSVVEGFALPPAGDPPPPPPPPPTPTPTPTPSPTPSPGPATAPGGTQAQPAAGAPPATASPAAAGPPAGAAPSLSVASAGRRGISFVVQCDSACSGSARLGVSRTLATRLGVAGPTVGSLHVARPSGGRATFTVRLTRRVMAAMARRHMRRLAATLAVVVADADGRRVARRTAVRVSR